jgi:hypothetical protein
MFPDLPSFADQIDTARHTVQLLGASDGILNAQDNLTDPFESILNPAVFSPHNADNPNMTAGMTFLGQLLDHDLIPIPGHNDPKWKDRCPQLRVHKERMAPGIWVKAFQAAQQVPTISS